MISQIAPNIATSTLVIYSPRFRPAKDMIHCAAKGVLAFTAVASLGMCPLQGDLNAVIASASDYTYLITGKRIDGTMYSCTSLGVKIGGGLGTAISGWLLAASGFIEGGAAVQPDSVITMLNVMYLWLPAIFCALVTFLLTKLNVEKANQALLASRKA